MSETTDLNLDAPRATTRPAAAEAGGLDESEEDRGAAASASGLAAPSAVQTAAASATNPRAVLLAAASASGLAAPSAVRTAAASAATVSSPPLPAPATLEQARAVKPFDVIDVFFSSTQWHTAMVVRIDQVCAKSPPVQAKPLPSSPLLPTAPATHPSLAFAAHSLRRKLHTGGCGQSGSYRGLGRR